MTSKFKLNQVLIAACIAAGAGALGYGIASRSSSGAEPAPAAAAPKPAATANAAKKDAPELKIPADYITAATSLSRTRLALTSAMSFCSLRS